MIAAPTRDLSRPEFVALMAMMAATVAFSVDSMLPALPQIGLELSPDAPNRAQLIVTSFVLGMGVGTFFTGPLSDRFGRKPIMIGGVAVYVLGAVLAWRAPTLELMLAARVLQGLGAAGPRVVAMAMVRDLHKGRAMAQMMSFIMLVFTLVPVIAPTLGYVLIVNFGWRSQFLAFVVFALTAMTWLLFRQPETLPTERRRGLSLPELLAALRTTLSTRTTVLATLVQALGFGMLFAVLSSTQQTFDLTYGRGESFHLWFGGIALLASGASLLNAWAVMRVGMRLIVKTTYLTQGALSAGMAVLLFLDLPQGVEFAAYLLWTLSLFFQAGLTIGNLNSLAMEPLGEIAGFAASAISAMATIGGVLIAAPIGLAFDGTPLPLAIGVLVCSIIGVLLTEQIKRAGED